MNYILAVKWWDFNHYTTISKNVTLSTSQFTVWPGKPTTAAELPHHGLVPGTAGGSGLRTSGSEAGTSLLAVGADAEKSDGPLGGMEQRECCPTIRSLSVVVLLISKELSNWELKLEQGALACFYCL